MGLDNRDSQNRQIYYSNWNCEQNWVDHHQCQQTEQRCNPCRCFVGPTGPTGPPGPPGPTTQLRGIQAQLISVNLGTVDDGDNVIFNTITNDQSLNLSYNVLTGEFTITAVGNYYVEWWVATDGAEASTTISFGIELNGGSGILGSSPIVTGQVNGSALVTVGATPAILALVNETGATVGLATTPVQANIVITEIVI